MRKNFFTYLLAVVLTAIVVSGFGSYLYTEHVVNKFIARSQEDIYKQIESGVLVYDKLFRVIEPQLNKAATAAILEISDKLSDPQLQKSLTPEDLKKMALLFSVDEIYLISADGVIFNTSFLPDMNHNLHTHTVEYSQYLRGLLGKGEVDMQEIAVSVNTGMLNTYALYSPEGSDYYVEVSVDVRRFIDRIYSDGMSEYLLGNLAIGIIEKNTCVKGFDVFDITNSGQWSLIRQGKRVSISKDAIKRVEKDGQYIIEDGDHLKLLRKANFDNVRYDWLRLLVVEVEYDFSALQKVGRNILMYSIFFGTVAFLVILVLLGRIFDSSVARRVTKIIKGIGEIQAGDVDTRIEISGNDELSLIANNINDMSKALTTSVTALRESKQRWRSIVETAGEGILLLSDNGMVLLANQAISKMLGYSCQELMHCNIDQLVEDEQCRNFIIETKDTDSCSCREDIAFKNKSGRKIWGIVSKSRLPDSKLNIICTLIMVMDITDRKDMENDREKLLNLLELKNRDLESIISTASHDLRSPLVNISGFSGELELSCNEAKACCENEAAMQDCSERLKEIIITELPEYTKIIKGGVEKMYTLVRALHKLSKLGRKALELVEIDMDALLNCTINSLSYKIQKESVEVIVTKLPPCYGEPGMVGEVFTNLLENSMKYRKLNSKCIIEVSGWMENDRVIYCIKDNGMGINEKFHEKIFEIFNRLGEGIGLTVVARVVSLHNGKVWVDSQAGKGASFYLSLPAQDCKT